MIFMLKTFFFMDYPRSWQTLFQKPATTMMEGIIDLHHDIFTFLVIIIVFVSVMLLTILIRFIEQQGQYKVLTFDGKIPFMKYKIAHGITHHTILETVWTIIPTLILLFIATPSFALIYALDEVVEPQVTLRVVGRQWYWTYEYPDFVDVEIPLREFLDVLPELEDLRQIKPLSKIADGYAIPQFFDNLLIFTSYSHKGLTSYYDCLMACLFPYDLNKIFPNIIYNTPGFSFNSYLIPTEDLFGGSFRLLEVTRRVVLPVLTNIRVLVTSYDVIHSWAVPSFGIKVDAVPGRLNEYFLNVNYLGIFYGQCSEICGVNHGFMPIKVEVTTEQLFRWWYFETALGENTSLQMISLRSGWRFPEGTERIFNCI